MRVAAADPELLAGVAPELAARLGRTFVAEVIHADVRAPFDVRRPVPEPFGLLVLDGVLTRRVAFGARASIELLGPGDIVRPWQGEEAATSLAGDVGWRVVEAARLAVLDAEFVATAARHPAVLAELASRFVQRSHALADRLAIAQIPRLDARVLAVLWHLADRWGRRERGRVTIALPLRHDTLADLACAQRPSVSLAVRSLVAAGRVARGADGSWELFGAPVSERELRRTRGPAEALGRPGRHAPAPTAAAPVA